MEDRIKVRLRQTLREPRKWTSGPVSETLFLNLCCTDSTWSSELVWRKAPECRIEFSADVAKGEAEIECLIVQKNLQRKGIGTALFSGMLKVLDRMSEALVLLGKLPIGVISGELRPDEPPLDQYEKSIPFYIRQAEINGFSIRFYDKSNCEEREVSAEEILALLDDYKEGRFQYAIAQEEPQTG